MTGRSGPTEQLAFHSTIFVTSTSLMGHPTPFQSDWWDGTKTFAHKLRKELSWTDPKSRFTTIDRKSTLSWDVKQPTYCSRGVGHGVPSVVVYLCHHVVGLARLARRTY